jgi:CelD/BcsL family acetyltransferase involved in cellulose biosynthesis
MRRDSSAAWTFEWRRSWADVWTDSFEAEWHRAYAAATRAHVFQHPQLARAWADTCGAASGDEPLIGVGTGPDGARVLLPWVIRRAAGRVAVRRQLVHLGDDLFGYHDPLATDTGGAIAWNQLWREARVAVAGDCDQAMLRSVDVARAPDGSPRTGDDSTVLSLTAHDGFEPLLAACAPKFRNDLRRLRRRLSERGTVTLWIAGRSEGGTALADWREHGAPAYREVWARRARRNTAWRPGLNDLLAKVLTDGLSEGWGHYAVLRVDGEPIAWHVGLADRKRLYWWIPAHRPEWETFAPGKLLLAAVIEELFERHWRELHFLAGAHPYKLAWRPDVQDLRVVRWHAPGVRGRILSWYDSLRQSA